jgi:hypothetical protein
MAALLVAVPPLFVTTHRYSDPFKPAVAPVKVNVAVVTPLYGGVFDRFDQTLPVSICH